MWLAICFIAAILFILAYLDTRKPENYPPGPKWLPIFGCALSVSKMRQKTGNLFKVTTQLAKDYGPVIGMKIGKDKIVVVDGADALKEFLTEDDFSGRPNGILYTARTWGMRRGIKLVDGEFWVEQRRFVLRNLREFGFGRRTMATMVEYEALDLVKTFMNKVKPQNSAIISMTDIFGVSVLNTLWTMMANNRYNPEDKEIKTLQSLLTELFNDLDIVGAPFSHFPILRYIAPNFSGYNKFLHTHQKILEFLHEELDKHFSTYKAGEARDLMDAYIEVLRSENKKPSFSEKQLVAICLDLFIAGSETTSKTLGFIFLYLLLFPDVQKKAQEEIDRVVGRDRPPMLSDRANMPYMEALVLEGVRMFAARNLALPHRALKDSYLQGYFIPKDTMIVINFYGVMMEHTCWPDPQDFRPDRFIVDNKIVIPDSYLPFGFGRHRCLGESLAKATLFLFTTSLLQTFNFSVPPGHPQPSTEVVDAVTVAPMPYQAKVEVRI